MSNNAASTPSLKDLVEEVLQLNTNFQKSIIVLIAFNAIFLGINHGITSFYVYTPDYNCTNPQFEPCDAGCPGFEFLAEDKTVVTEFELICSRRYLSALLNSLYFLGNIIGAFLVGVLADWLGRKKVVFTSVFVQGLIGLSIYFVGSLEAIIALRMIQGIFVQCNISSSFSMVSEFCSRAWRSYMTVIWQCFFSLGLIYLAVIDYFLRDWRLLQLLAVVPCIVPLISVWIVPESPRWLMAKSRVKETVTICKKFDKSFPTAGEFKQEENLLKETKKGNNYTKLFTIPLLRKHLLLNSATFFSIGLANFGIFYFLPETFGERHFNYLISGIIEMVTCVVTLFVLKAFGRRYPMAVCELGTAICLTILGILSQFGSEDLAFEISIVILAQIGRALTVAGFMIMMIMGAESFPTVCRGNGHGICSAFASAGSLLAPQMMLLSEYSSTIVPMLIYSVFLVLAGCGTFFLPETNNVQLPNTIEDAMIIWGKKSK